MTKAAIAYRSDSDAMPELAWYERMRRAGQNNFNEHDPETFDVEAWIDYWKRLKLDTLLLSGGGIMAFYPTQVPFHHRSRYLGDRDLFGEMTVAAKRAGMRVVARMDCNWCYEDGVNAHPEWVARNDDGSPYRHPEATDLYRTCMFSEFYTEHFPKIYREMNSLYDLDGFFTNGWPSTHRPPKTFGPASQYLSKLQSQQFLPIYEKRIIEIWKLWDSVAKEKRQSNLYVGNLGGSIRATTDVMEIAKVAGWFNADHQGRSDNLPIWDCAQQGRVAYSVMGGRAVTNVTGGYATTTPLWRHTSKAPAEATSWMAQSTASGMVPWYHWLGGSPEDQRFKSTGEAFFSWLAANEQHFFNKRTIANVGVVFSQRTNNFYKPPGGGDITDPLQGWYYAMLTARIPFDFVHEQSLGTDALKKYSVLVLPNCAMLSDSQIAGIKAYVKAGGSVVATFETACFDEWGRRRTTPGLADLFGVTVTGGPSGGGLAEHARHRGHYARIERSHPILEGFGDTKILPNGEYRMPIEGGNTDILSVIEPYASFPPEMVYTDTPRTDESAIRVLEAGEGRVVWFSGDIDRCFWLSSNHDLQRLMENSVRWGMRGAQSVRVEGAGLIEMFAWETESGFALHLLNYTSPNALRGWLRETYPLGPQAVTFAVPDGRRIETVQTLRSGKSIAFKQNDSIVTFTLEGIGDYEVVALT